MRKILQWKIVFGLLLLSSVAWAQTRSGKVTLAENGSSTPGVNVVRITP